MEPAIKIIDLDDEPVASPAAEPLHYPQITSDFLFGGRAYFRVLNPKGESLLYLIKSRAGRQGTQWVGETNYFLRVFINATTGFVYVGVVNPETGDIKPTGRTKFVSGQREHDAAQWAIMAVINQEPIASGYQIVHDGRCGVCGRALQSTGDRKTGFHLDCEPSGAQRVREVELRVD